MKNKTNIIKYNLKLMFIDSCFNIFSNNLIVKLIYYVTNFKIICYVLINFDLKLIFLFIQI
jgi:hypothetical protein